MSLTKRTTSFSKTEVKLHQISSAWSQLKNQASSTSTVEQPSSSNNRKSSSGRSRQLVQTSKSAEVYLCKTLYQYVKKLADVPNEPVGNWRNICDRLQEAGYKTQSSVKAKLSSSLPIDALVKIVDMGFENQNTLTIDINIRLEFPSTSETPKTEDLDRDG